MASGPDIILINNGATWTLQAGTERGFTWLHDNAGTDEREIEMEASHARALAVRAGAQGLAVTSDS